MLANPLTIKVQKAHTAASSDVGDADNEQEEEPAELNEENVAESKGTQENEEEYDELEMYEHEYYTLESDDEGLFALTEVPAAKHEKKEPGNEVCMHKVWIMVAKDTID
ncbi:hypothetical protein E4T56_gene1557 [Termitomyces sp. T112]|nr:hypothetical protein E4T56_gene1557 [Termitomyces sp. T112]